MMVAEMSLVDEKKTQDEVAVGSTKVADAEALALAALKAAEEAKRAAERLKDLRACLSYLQEEKSLPSKSIEEKEPVEEETRDVKAEDAKPADPPTSPISILKTEDASEKPSTETKEVRLAPDTIIKDDEAPPKELPEQESDVLVSMLDAVGLDKMCGLEFEEDMGDVNPHARYAVAIGNDPFGGSLPIRTAAARSAAKAAVQKASVAPAPAVEPEAPAAAAPAPVEPAVVESEASASPEPEVPVKEETPAPVPPTPEEKTESEAAETAIVPAKPQKMTDISEIKQHIMHRRRQDDILRKPDPFGGDEEGMDFIPCGW